MSTNIDDTALRILVGSSIKAAAWVRAAERANSETLKLAINEDIGDQKKSALGYWLNQALASEAKADPGVAGSRQVPPEGVIEAEDGESVPRTKSMGRWEEIPGSIFKQFVKPSDQNPEPVWEKPAFEIIPAAAEERGRPAREVTGETPVLPSVREAQPTEIEPYDQRRVVAECRFYLSQSAETMLEAGRRLIILKAHEPHGEFERIVENELGLPARTAQRMMASAIRFLSPQLAAKAPTLALLGKSKLFELLTEDDDEIAGLADGGTVAGLSLDDVDRMSVRELRAALRKSKAEAEAKLRETQGALDASRKLALERHQTIDRLQEEAYAKKLKGPDPDAEAEGMRAALQALSHQLKATVMTAFTGGADRLIEHGLKQGIDQRPFIAGLLIELEQEIDLVRERRAIPRQLISPGLATEWCQGEDPE